MVEVDQAELAVVEVAATRSNRLVRANRLDTLRRWCLLVVAVAKVVEEVVLAQVVEVVEEEKGVGVVGVKEVGVVKVLQYTFLLEQSNLVGRLLQTRRPLDRLQVVVERVVVAEDLEVVAVVVEVLVVVVEEAAEVSSSSSRKAGTLCSRHCKKQERKVCQHRVTNYEPSKQQ